VAAPTLSRKKSPVPEVRCANCGHAETQHGRSGTKPCLATVGELANIGFCACDEFRPEAKKAA
jgi:hypothetical protein